MKKYFIYLTAILLLLGFNFVFAAGNQMNGISFESVDGFWNKWHLVTVRARTDTNELRFIYANDIAWAHIEKSRKAGVIFPTDYPDGSAFGKTPFALTPDSLFESSMMPDHVLRYQIMVKDARKYQKTRGWGYAIFGMNGKLQANTNSLNPQADPTIACVACHEQAKKRGYVFIGEMNSAPSEVTMSAVAPRPMSDATPLFNFARAKVKDFGRNFDFLQASKMEIAIQSDQDVFPGTLNEVMPLLIKHSIETGLPSAVMSKNQERYAIAYADEDSKCTLVKARTYYRKTNSQIFETTSTNRVCR